MNHDIILFSVISLSVSICVIVYCYENAIIFALAISTLLLVIVSVSLYEEIRGECNMKNNLVSAVLIIVGFILLNIVSDIKFLSIDYLVMVLSAVLFVIAGGIQR